MHLIAVSINQSSLQYKKNKTNLSYQSTPSFKAVRGLGNDSGKALKDLSEMLAHNKALLPVFQEKIDRINSQFEKIAAIKGDLQQQARAALMEKLKNLSKEIFAAVNDATLQNNSRTIEQANKNLSSKSHFVPVKGFGMGKIAGYDETKNILNEYFISKIKLEKEGKNVDIPSAFFFFGPKGNGKTTSTLAIAEETGCNISKLLFSKNLETPEEFFNRILKIAEDTKNKFNEKGRTILFSDEFTTYMAPETGIKEKMLNFLKDCSQKYKCTFFGTTNHLSKAGEEIKEINPVFVSFDPPSKTDMIQVLKYYVNGREAEPINYSRLADEMRKFAKSQNKILTNADIYRLTQDVGSEGNNPLYTEKDLLNYLKYKYRSTLLSEERLKNYKEDYIRFIKN